MIRYHQLGELPARKHTAFHRPDGQGLYREELFSSGGFSGIYSTKYHVHMPTSIGRMRLLAGIEPELLTPRPLQPFHFTTQAPSSHGDFIDARLPLLANGDLCYSVLRPDRPGLRFYKNANFHELYFIHSGSGSLESEYGSLSFRPGDYLAVPKGTIYTLHHDSPEGNKFLLVESASPYEIPREFRNDHGQILEHAPYCERDFRLPVMRPAKDERGTFELVIDHRPQRTLFELDHHPFDLVGWDGHVYPVAFNIADYAPVVGQLHQPPSVHKVFDTRHFMVTNFVPRLLDFHPKAIPIPYYHFNCDCDEILYYMKGNFMSRKGIQEGSVTLHPMGVPHGPQPGKIEASLGQKDVDEWAVMVDTYSTVHLCKWAGAELVEDYFKSWNT